MQKPIVILDVGFQLSTQKRLRVSTQTIKQERVHVATQLAPHAASSVRMRHAGVRATREVDTSIGQIHNTGFKYRFERVKRSCTCSEHDEAEEASVLCRQEPTHGYTTPRAQFTLGAPRVGCIMHWVHHPLGASHMLGASGLGASRGGCIMHWVLQALGASPTRCITHWVRHALGALRGVCWVHHMLGASPVWSILSWANQHWVRDVLFTSRVA